MSCLRNPWVQLLKSKIVLANVLTPNSRFSLGNQDEIATVFAQPWRT